MSKLSPATGKPMRAIEFMGVAVDICPETGGVWFDDGELPKVRESMAKAFPTLEKIVAPEAMLMPPTATARRCPVDAEPLRTYRYLFQSNVFLDECPKCWGVWVDEGELQSMHLALQEQMAYPQELPAEVTARLQLDEFAAAHMDRTAFLEGLRGAFTLLARRPFCT